MGFAPAAIGAKMGRPDHEVVAIIGDGGFQMTIQELELFFKLKFQSKL
jgi:acetolactate synthase-1/2/3 large subunit